MSLQPMALFDALLAGASYRKWGETTGAPIGAQFRQALLESKRVHAPSAAATAWNLDEPPPGIAQIGQQVLPFPIMWIEVETSELAAGELGLFQANSLSGDFRIGSFVRSISEREFRIQSFAMAGTDIIQLKHSFQVEASEDGTILASGPVQIVNSLGEQHQPIADVDHISAMHQSVGALFTIGLMNCRNVTTERIDRPNVKVRSSNPKLRKVPPKLDYHTIILTGSKSGGDGAGEHQGAMPQHKVRGHFKTFTADRPLMGRHVGTYWWGWNVRGSKKNGITVTDYKVGAA